MSWEMPECEACGEQIGRGHVYCAGCDCSLHRECAYLPIEDTDIKDATDYSPGCVDEAFCPLCQNANLNPNDVRFIQGWCEGITATGVERLTMPMLQSLLDAELLNQSTTLRLPLVSKVDSEAFELSSDLGFRVLIGAQSEDQSHHRVLTEYAAEFLASRKRELPLTGFTGLPAKAAIHLGRHTGDLVLLFLRDLSREAAKALSHHKGLIWISSNLQVPPEVMSELTDQSSPEQADETHPIPVGIRPKFGSEDTCVLDPNTAPGKAMQILIESCLGRISPVDIGLGEEFDFFVGEGQRFSLTQIRNLVENRHRISISSHPEGEALREVLDDCETEPEEAP